jgi:hypothetical protein
MKTGTAAALAAPSSIACLFLFANLLAGACVVESVCFNNADCPAEQACVLLQGASRPRCVNRCRDDGDCRAGQICSSASGVCQTAECRTDGDCGGGLACRNGRCESFPLPDGSLLDGGATDADAAASPVLVFMCPEGMVPIEREFCIDIYEASRFDARENNPGADESMAASQEGVIPWTVPSNAAAQQACEAAGKTLCTARQWEKACRGPAGTVYGYGNDYDPVICNGIDKYCLCPEGSSCAGHTPCPFPHCYTECGGDYLFTPFRLDTTGANPGCTNGYGVFDMNGNLWEHVFGGDERSIRGGAYNCADSVKLHRCDYIPGDWEPSARGFRCCSAGRFVSEEEAAQAADGGQGR